MSKLNDIIYDALAGYDEGLQETADLVERALVEATGGPFHTVKIDEFGAWVIQHPLSERFEGTLFDCTFDGHLILWLAATPPADRPAGLYVAHIDQSGFRIERDDA